MEFRSLDVCPDCGSKFRRVGNTYVCSGSCCRFVAGDAYDVEAWGMKYDESPNNDAWRISREVFSKVLEMVRDCSIVAGKTQAKALFEKLLRVPLDRLNASSFLCKRSELLPLWNKLAGEEADDLPRYDWFLVTPRLAGPSKIVGLEAWPGNATSYCTAPDLPGYTGLGLFTGTVNLCFTPDTYRRTLQIDAGPTRRLLPTDMRFLPGLAVPPAKESYRFVVADDEDLNMAIKASVDYPSIPVALMTGDIILPGDRSVGGTVVRRALDLRKSGDEDALKTFLTKLGKTDEMCVRLRMAGFDVKSREGEAVVTGLRVTSAGYEDKDGVIATFTIEPRLWEESLSGRRCLRADVTVADTTFSLLLDSKTLSSGNELVKYVLSECLSRGKPARLIRKKEAETILVDTLSKSECVDTKLVTPFPQKYREAYLLPGATVTEDSIDGEGAVTGPEFATTVDTGEIPVNGEELNLLLIAGAMVARAAAGRDIPPVVVHPDHKASVELLKSWLGQKAYTSGNPAKPFCHVAEPSSASPVSGAVFVRHDGIKMIDAKGTVVDPVLFIRRCAQASLLGLAALSGKPTLDTLTAEGSYLMDTVFPGKLPVRLDLQDLPHTCRFLKKIEHEINLAVIFSFKSQTYRIRPQDYDVDKKRVFDELSARDRDVFTDGADIFLTIPTWRSLSLAYYRREVETGRG